MVNVQYVVHDGKVYVIEVNPRSSRTVPYISKVTDIPMVDLATRIMTGATLRELGYEPGLNPEKDYVAVKVPVFSFAKLADVDTQLGPEMKSTGEVLGVAHEFEDALYKALVASGNKMEREGGVLISVRDMDKDEALETAKRFADLGFTIYATAGTSRHLSRNGVVNYEVRKLSEAGPNIGDLLDSGKVTYVISTSTKGRQPGLDEVRMRRKAVERSIHLLTSLDTANALVSSLENGRTMEDIELVDITAI